MSSLAPFIYLSVSAVVAFVAMNLARSLPVSHGMPTILLALVILALGFALDSYPMFMFLSAIVMLMAAPKEHDKRVALAVFLILAFPQLHDDIVVGGAKVLELSWPRLVSICLLVPILLAPNKEMNPGNPVDKFVLLWVFYSCALVFREGSITAQIRDLISICLDVVVPYFVISRVIRNRDQLQLVVLGAVTAFLFAGVINFLETLHHWHLFERMSDLTPARSDYIQRGGFLRGVGPHERPSQAAFVLGMAPGLFWAIYPTLKNRFLSMAILAMIFLGLIVTFSRGGWVGAAIIVIGFLWVARRKVIPVLFLGGLLGLIALPLLPPIVSDLVMGTDEKASQTVTHRENLWSASLEAARDNPFFGDPEYTNHPALQVVAQYSWGFIDVVNHYALVLLSMGYVGLILFVALFLSVIRYLYKVSNLDAGEGVIPMAFAVSLVAGLAMIATTSALGASGTLLWLMVALSGACIGQSSLANSASQGGQNRVRR